MPESPRYLVKAGHLREAKELLQRLRTPGDSSSEKEENRQATEEYEAIVDAVKLEKEHTGMDNYWNMFWGKGAYRLPRLNTDVHDSTICWQVPESSISLAEFNYLSGCKSSKSRFFSCILMGSVLMTPGGSALPPSQYMLRPYSRVPVSVHGSHSGFRG